jgi:hypothetical protein
MAGRGESVRTEAQLQWNEKFSWTTEPWRIPTNLVTEPLTSFTVARGIAPWLERVKDFSKLGLRQTPNQICAWGISNDQPRVFFTMPVADATNAVRQLAPTPRIHLARLTNALGSFHTSAIEPKSSEQLAHCPYLRPAADAGSEFLFGGIFPPSASAYPCPMSSTPRCEGERIWCITTGKIPRSDWAWRFIFQLASIVAQCGLPEKDSVSQRWLVAIRPKLANTVTEITQTGPRELSWSGGRRSG